MMELRIGLVLSLSCFKPMRLKLADLYVTRLTNIGTFFIMDVYHDYYQEEGSLQDYDGSRAIILGI